MYNNSNVYSYCVFFMNNSSSSYTITIYTIAVVSLVSIIIHHVLGYYSKLLTAYSLTVLQLLNKL